MSAAWPTARLACSLVLLLPLLGGRASFGLVPPASSSSDTGCKLSEHRCASSRSCIAQDRFCDGENDCQDKSDEPVYCTPCNRTLYGDVGRTYELQVRRPREERLPFLCHLNFTAAGGELGDLVQLTFDTFTVGRFQSFTSEGCPDGHMSIKEEGRPPTGGQWCGSAWGYTVYYSETRSINLTLYLSRLSGQGNDYNFDFKLSYKFLKRSEAHLRYGNSSMSTWRGELVNATYCDRVFTRCDTRACRLQSPNYPGVYPRNVTCYYRVEQKRAPPGHRALLAVSQRNSHKIHIKDQVNKYDTSQRTLRLWDQCNVVQDYLTVYDGGSTQDRVLVRLCGGDAVPDIIGSKDVMLLEFHTSPYDNPFHPVPLSFLPGFELEVQVIFVDERSTASFVVKDHEKCDFYITSYEGAYGVLENPKHSLPPNTTCRYHFQGKPNEIVWLAFVKYYAAWASTELGLGAVGTAGGSAAAAGGGGGARAASSHSHQGAECNVKLLIWDGQRQPALNTTSSSSGQQSSEARLMGEFCKDEVPRLCDHSLLRNASRQARPCSLAESYVSRGRYLTLEHLLRQGSALYPVSFVLRYEFVHQATSCDRVFRPREREPSAGGLEQPQAFGSPRNVFFYGRGGAQNLSCVYSFEPGPEHRLELAVGRASFGQRNCWSWIDPLVNRWTCERPSREGEGIAELRLSEYPWQGVQLPRDCLCSNLSERLVFQSLSSALLELTFTVERMNVTQDYEDFFFEAEYRFVPASEPLAGQNHDNSLSRQQQHHQQSQQQQPQHNNQHGGARSQQLHHHCHHSSRLLSDSPQTTRLGRLEERRLRGTSGEIALRSPPKTVASSEQLAVLATIDEEVAAASGEQAGEAATAAPATGLAAEVTRCANEPWLIEPEDSRLHFLYLKTPGFRLTRRNLQDCPTRNRIVVYPAASPHERTVVCPAEGNLTLHEQQRVVDLISGGWNRSSGSSATRPAGFATAQQERPLPQHQQQHARSFVVEFLQREPGAYIVTWMAISKRLLSQPTNNFFGNALAPSAADCPYRCPELEACISSVLWCDGVRHCPSGFDEREENCSYRLGLTLLYVAVGAGALGIFLIFLLATGCLKYCLYRRRRLQRRHLQKKLPPQAVADEQQRSIQKKKVQVLSVNHLNSPTNHSASRNNGSLESRHQDVQQQQQQQQQQPPPQQEPQQLPQQQQQQQQPRYANATFARIGRYPTNSLSRQHQQQQLQSRLRNDQLDEEEDEFAASSYSKDNIC